MRFWNGMQKIALSDAKMILVGNDLNGQPAYTTLDELKAFTGASILGVATVAGTPNVVAGTAASYMATEVGTYTNYGGLTVATNQFAILFWSGAAWSKSLVSIDITSKVNISDIQKGYLFVGIATTATVPPNYTANDRVYYSIDCPASATTLTLPNFGGLVIPILTVPTRYSLRWGGTSWSGVADNSKIDTSKIDIYNITENIPLNAGQYYTLQTAISAVPLSIKKTGLQLSFEASNSIYEDYKFYGHSVASWNNTYNWRKIQRTDINIKGISDSVCKYAITDGTPESENGYYNINTGVFVPFGSFKSKKHPINSIDEYCVSSATYGTSVCLAVYFDVNGLYISYEKQGSLNAQTTYVRELLNIPSTAAFVGLTNYPSAAYSILEKRTQEATSPKEVNTQIESKLKQITGSSITDGISQKVISDSIKKINILNLKTNGDFENGTTGYTGFGATISSSTEQAYNGTHSLKAVATSADGGFFGSFVPTPDHNYYFGFWSKDGTSTSICVDIYNTSGIYFASKIPSNGETANWKQFAYRFTPSTNATIYLRPYVNKTLNASVGDYRYFDCFVLIDLTAAFGVGNEPDTDTFKNWMLKYANGFIDQYEVLPLLNPLILNSQESTFANNSSISKMLLSFDSINNSIGIFSKISKTRNSVINFSKYGVNSLMALKSWGWYNDKNLNVVKPDLQKTITTIGGDSDNIGPYQISADSNGDSGAINLTGGYHGSGVGGLTPTAMTVSYSVYIDGKRVSTTGDYEGKRADVYANNKIMGYNTITLGRYILSERLHYSIFDGKIEVEVTITPLEAVTFSLYYGLQLTGSSFFTKIHFVNSDIDEPQDNITGLTSGLKTTNFIDTVQLSNTDVCMDFHIDNGYGLGIRDSVADTYPCFFRSGGKLYANLIRNTLQKSAFANLGWKGSYDFRSNV